MDTIKKLVDFVLQGFNDFDFVRAFNRILEFFGIVKGAVEKK